MDNTIPRGCGEGLVEALNTRVTGNGTQALVLSHGYGGDQFVWQFLIPVLACYFKVVVFDLAFAPNVNNDYYDPERYSDFSAYSQDLICILDQLNVKKTIFLGHSMSAMIGCIASTQRPDLFEHLILLNGSPRYLNATGYNGGFNNATVNSVFSSIETNFSEWVQVFTPQVVGANDSAAVAELESSFNRMQPWIALSVARTVLLSDNRRILPGVSVPRVTIIQSRGDILVPESVAFYIWRELSSVGKQHKQVKILEAIGHFPQLTAPGQLLRVLLKSVLA